jgi:uncharacterized protein
VAGIAENLRVHRCPSAHAPMTHPCLSCGACCAAFRVSMHWSETEPALGGRVPIELTETLGPHQRCMRGTWAKRPHCVALQGEVGTAAHCSIYPQRPMACRELKLSWEDGTHSPQCDKARALYRLPPLTREDIEAFLSTPAP